MNEPTPYGQQKITAACDAAFGYGRASHARKEIDRLEANRTENELAEYVAQLEQVAAELIAGEQVQQDVLDAIRDATTQYWARYDAEHPGAAVQGYAMPEEEDA